MPLRLLFALTVAPVALLAQTASPSFEAASVKLLAPPISGRVFTGGGPGTSDPALLTRSNVSLASIIMQAFEIQGRLIRGPDWLTTERYEILAVIPAGATREDVPLMLQKLLAERFGLVFHREPKEVRGLALVVTRSGVKLTPSGSMPLPIPAREGFPAVPEGVAPGIIKIDSAGAIRRFAAGAMSIGGLADYLAGQLDVSVTDMTKLTGNYDVILYYTRQSQTGDLAPDLVDAVREQLGLELRPISTTVSQFVVDHIERTPTPN